MSPWRPLPGSDGPAAASLAQPTVKNHPLEAMALVTLAVTHAALVLARAVVLPLLALVIVLLVPSAGRPPAPAPAPSPAAPAPCLDRLTVVQLRALARAAGHRQLARSGRRADLLVALGACG